MAESAASATTATAATTATTTATTTTTTTTATTTTAAPKGALQAEEFLQFVQNRVITDNDWRTKLVLVLVGLPARGKSFLAHKLVTYLRWRGMSAQLFNVGQTRRKHATQQQDSSFFDHSNSSATAQREQLALEALGQLLDWLAAGNDIAIFDATNTTAARRNRVMLECKKRSPLLNVVYVESYCDDASVLETNYRAKVMNSPDYKHMPVEQALADLRHRVENYEKVYQPLTDDNQSYIKIINLSSKIICNKVYGALAHSVSSYLMSIHIQPRPIYLVRCGHAQGSEVHTDDNNNDSNSNSNSPKSTSSSATNNSNNLSPPSFSQQQNSNSNNSNSMRSSSSSHNLSQASKDVGDLENSALKHREGQHEGEPHIPYTLPLDCNLSERGIAFSVCLSEFLMQKCDAYWREHEELWRYIQEYLQLSTTAEAAAEHIRSENDSAAVEQQQQQQQQKQQKQKQPTSLADVVAAAANHHSQSSPLLPNPNNIDPNDNSYHHNSSNSSNSNSPRNTSVNNHTHLPLVVYTSTAPRAIETAAPLASAAQYTEQHSSLNQLDMGEAHGCSLSDLRLNSPSVLLQWAKDRYRYRWPGGESQHDKARALSPLVMELERQRFPALVVSHASTLQVLYAYFVGSASADVYALNLPSDVVIELIPSQYGWQERRYDFRADVNRKLKEARDSEQQEIEQKAAEAAEAAAIAEREREEREQEEAMTPEQQQQKQLTRAISAVTPSSSATSHERSRQSLPHQHSGSSLLSLSTTTPLSAIAAAAVSTSTSSTSTTTNSPANATAMRQTLMQRTLGISHYNQDS